MGISILTTKLYIPPANLELVSRPRLIEQLNKGVHRKLTLISAPAGFGKTSLVSEWVAGCEQPVAWISLSRDDSDPTRFLTYLITALQRIKDTIGDRLLSVVQSPQPTLHESILTSLLNDIAAVPVDFILALDDYHLVDSQAVDQILAFLLENQPPHMHLIITTREDPPFPLARLRARNQLTELRVADLRFTPDETADFLNRVMGLNLPEEAIDALDKRTEGWITGLQLAALSMQEHQNKAGFIASFTGSHRFVLDYLVEEVLEHQPEDIQNFLLQTAILDRLTASLCNALTGQDDGQKTLEYLERANLFLISLDAERSWYRYHHLFADLLRQRLRHSGKNLDELHIRASQWFEEQGFELEAFQHAVAANDVDRAERLMHGEGMPLYFRGATGPVLNWLESLSTTVLDANPSLWVSYATALTIVGRQISNVEEKLRAAEIVLQNAEPDARTRDLIGQIAANRAMLAILQNQVDTIIAQSQRALAYLHPDNLSLRTTVTWTLGYAYQLRGERSAARQAYIDTIPISQASGNTMITIGASVSLGQIQEADNQLRSAAETYGRVLSLAGEPPLPGAGEAYFGLARLCYEWNNLEEAAHHAQQSLPLALKLENVDTPGLIWLFFSRIDLALGDIAAAADAVQNAERFFRERQFMHRVGEVAAARIRILLHQGNTEAAANLAEEYDLPMSKAQVLLAQGDVPAALAVLEPQRQMMESNGWLDEHLKVMVLQAVAYHSDGRSEQALQMLRGILDLAAPEGFTRLFVDEGPPMQQLLSQAADQGIMPEYTARLLAAFRGIKEPPDPAQSQPLIEPLSERELEVLQLIAEGLSNREIGERLFLALDTVKGHNRRLYAKLQVGRRTEAVARARELGLIET